MSILFRRGIAFYCIFLMCLVSISLCSAQPVNPVLAPSAPPAGQDSDVLATVGDLSITRGMMQEELKNFEPRPNAQPEGFNMKQFFSEMVEMKLLELESAKQADLNTPEIQKKGREVATALLAQTMIRGLLEEATKDQKAPSLPAMGERYHVHKITLPTMEEAVKVKKELDGGKSFMEIAKTASIDPFKASGGDAGYLALTEIPAEIGAILKGMKANVVSDPIKEAGEKGGFVLVKFSEIKPSDPLENAKPGLQQVPQEIQKAAFVKIMEQMKTSMGVKVDDAVLKLLEKGPVSPEDKEKVFLTIGSDSAKLGELAADLEEIPEFLRPQILGGEGMKDFQNQFIYRFVIRKNVERNFDQLAAKYPAVVGRATRENLIRSYLSQKMKGTTVSDEEIKDFYTKNIEKFKRAEGYKAHHILVDAEDKAKNIFERLTTKKESFEDIAKKESKCPSGKEGGDLGSFEKGRMVPEFDKALETAEVGKVFGPIKTQFGYHIIRLDEKVPAGSASLEETKARIKGELQPQKERQAFEALMAELKKKYPVKEFPEKF